ncbi:MAG: helix-turn-helix domain-containing protein [Granulosicoccus sp.]
MTSTSQKNKAPAQTRGNSKTHRVQRPGKLKASPTLRQNAAASRLSSKPLSVEQKRANDKPLPMKPSLTDNGDAKARHTAIEQCVQNELRRYFDMLDGEEPANLYRMVIKQAESALVSMVMEECRGNQTRASEWLGISRGNLRTKLASMEK